MTSHNYDIKLIIYDFDGVMTDNKALLFNDGSEAVFINRVDGLAIGEIKKLGLIQYIVTTEKNKIVHKRAEKLKIPIFSGIDNKLSCIKEIMREENVLNENVMYIGNDINDLEAMLYVGLPISPNDGHKSIKEISKFVTKKSGGDGVIREIFDIFFVRRES